MKIAVVYPHSRVPDPPRDLFDALAVVSWEISRRLARRDEVVLYPRRARGDREVDTFPGIGGTGRVRVHRIPVLSDQLANRSNVFDRFRSPERPYRVSSSYYARYAARVARRLRAERFDIVHLYNFTNFVPVFRRALPEARIVLHIHDHAINDFDRDVYVPRLRDVDLVLTCSEFVARRVRERFPEVADRCRTLHNGVDLDGIRPADGAQPAGRRVLFVGRLSPEKGVHVLLRAFRRLASRLPDARLTLIGPRDLAPPQFVDPLDRDPHLAAVKPFYGNPARWQAELEAGSDAAVDDRIRFIGPVRNAELGRHFAEAEVFAFPSLWDEPFGMPVVEAMAAGLPVVATRAGAFPETVADGETGLLVERGSAEELAGALERLLTDPEVARRMGAAGRARAEREFSWDAKVDELRALYEEIL